MTPMDDQVIALALVYRDALWLVAKRKASSHLGGYWEFPGGKVLADETPVQAALRELYEECGVRARVLTTLPRVTWRYADRTVTLIPVVCGWQAGEPRAQESTACRWVSGTELAQLEMPQANAAIVQAVREWCARNA